MTDGPPDTAVAIIGLAGRFPGAPNVDGLWKNLLNGVESISRFSPEELHAAGVATEELSRPEYVPARGTLEDIEFFDAAFFGMTPREAQLADPQHRLFLECAHDALEHAAIAPDAPQTGLIGVYGGCSQSTYLFSNLLSHRELVRRAGTAQLLSGCDKDYLCARVSYALDLRGPSIAIQTACSSSLVAVHTAIQGLVAGDCDVALAGGSTIYVPHRVGYFYQEGSITSPDGHCRAFDEDARGAVPGNGAALVVLKLIDRALADGDNVYAVIRGSAINNDGSRKAGFSAPGVDGQSAVIAEALAVAGVDAGSIGYVEAHGTGTTVGDPIELAALRQAYRRDTDRKGFCAIGSVKTNIGHLDTAAGVTGLIKVVLSLHHGAIPASLHYRRPNPRLEIEDSPFFVNAELRPWPRMGRPRRAGVSSFGIGGTNAHVIVEEAPLAGPAPASQGPYLLALSAHTPTALEHIGHRLADHLSAHPDLDLADASHTLLVGRRRRRHRRVAVCATREQAIEKLRHTASWHGGVYEEADRGVAFLFPGQGAQFVGMGRDLYRKEPRFRAVVDECAEKLAPLLGMDLRQVLYPADARAEELAERLLVQTHITQPALFVVELALARLWMSWGVQPSALLGHSLGEYVAACLAGVFSLERALALVAVRGRLQQSVPPGSMLAVNLPDAEARALAVHPICLAAVNGPAQCTLAGPPEAMQSMAARLSARGVPFRELATSHAFHSSMMDPILPAFRRELEQVHLQEPEIPYISNVSGRWITAAEATDPAYWVAQLREPVRFWGGLTRLTEDSHVSLIEVGPGQALTRLAQAHAGMGHWTVQTLPARSLADDSQETFLQAVGTLWMTGAAADFGAWFRAGARGKAVLPTYPYERKRYWIDPPRESARNVEDEPLAMDALEHDDAPRPELSGDYVEPRTDIERQVADIWREFLGIARVGAHDGFFELGGSSLVATRVTARLREVFAVEVPMDVVLRGDSTVARVAEMIEELLLAALEKLSEDEAQAQLESE
jgi:acyl transferase domain-containing protein